MPSRGIGMGGEGCGIEVCLGLRLQIKVVVHVLASDECRRVANFQLADIGWDIADGKANSPIR